MVSLEELEELGYNELRHECKLANLGGRGTREELIEKLAEHLSAQTPGGRSSAREEEVIPPPTNSHETPVAPKATGAAKTTRTALKGVVDAKPTTTKQAKTPAKTPARQSRALQTAAKTPLPDDDEERVGRRTTRSAVKPGRPSSSRPSSAKRPGSSQRRQAHASAGLPVAHLLRLLSIYSAVFLAIVAGTTLLQRQGLLGPLPYDKLVQEYTHKAQEAGAKLRAATEPYTRPFEHAASAVGHQVQHAAGAVQHAAGQAGQKVDAALGGIPHAVGSSVSRGVNGVRTVVGRGVSGVYQAVSGVASKVGQGLSGVRRGLEQGIAFLGEKVGGAVVTARARTVRAVDALRARTVDAGRWFAGKLGEQFQGLVHFLRGVLSLPGKAAAVAKNAAHSLAGLVKAGVQKAAYLAGELVGFAEKAASSAKSAAGDAGRKLQSGVSQAASKASDAAQKVKSAAGDAVHKAGGAVHKAGDVAGNAAHKASDAAHAAAEAAKKAATSAGDVASAAGHKAGDAMHAAADKIPHSTPEPAAAQQPPPAPATPTCATRINSKVLNNLMPVGSVWDGAREAATDVFQGQKDDPHKAMALLFATSSREASSDVSSSLQLAVPYDCLTCLFRLQGVLWANVGPEGRGELQKFLAEFLERCPNGIVMLEDLDAMSPTLLPVLINALSEQGGFEQDGRFVPASGALYILGVVVPETTFYAADEASFKVAVKTFLVDSLVSRSASPEDGLAQATAFRRRIEHVLPVAP